MRGLCDWSQVGEEDSLEALAPILRGRPLISFNFANMMVRRTLPSARAKSASSGSRLCPAEGRLLRADEEGCF